MKTMMNWKRVLAAALALTVMIAVTGCTPTGPSQEEYDALLAQVGTLQEEVETLRATSEELQTEIDRLLEENGGLTEEIDALLAMLNEVDGALNEAEESLEQTSVAVQESAAAQNPPAATSITAVAFTKTTDLTMNVGDTNRRAATTTPAGGTVAYASSNTAVATVDAAGNVTCKTAGSTVISATSGGVTASYKLTVTAANTGSSTTASSTVNGVFSGYTVTVTDKTTPATDMNGDNTTMHFISSSGVKLGSITRTAYLAIIKANEKTVQLPSGASYSSPPSGDSWNAWFASEYNKYRNVSGFSSDTPNSSVDSDIDTSSYANELLRLINNVRSTEGLHEYDSSSACSSLAQTRAQELADSFGHTRPGGGTVADEGYAEVIHNGSRSVSTAASAFQAYRNSASHNKILLSDRYNYFGAACYQANGKIYWVVVFCK